ncbi:arylamine N-acetyltransferase family protein [Amycolatopsis acidicola]|uniref:arylamine N-acetyltransferase family protein n=1 Tax=Amycolatopsis acidicola TaxID=2596893 RepID=UPI00140B360E|nr:arylamine N-acetyltransferase [Amycolatopsis acidicola]
MIDIDGYLLRLGITEREPPSAEALWRLHTAHITHVPYDSLDIQLGRPGPLDPAASAGRVVRDGRSGYCYHLNGAFSELLKGLGYRVTRHKGGSSMSPGEPPNVDGGHLALTVTGLGDDGWMVDAGLGDGLFTPVPLVEGTYRQGPFSFALRHSAVAPGGWQFVHDEQGSFHALDFGPEPVEMDVFAEEHEHLSRSPESGFVRTCTVQRRDACSIDLLRSLTLTRFDASGKSKTLLDKEKDWRAAIVDVFGVEPHAYPDEDWTKLWKLAAAQHERYLARKAGGTR